MYNKILKAYYNLIASFITLSRYYNKYSSIKQIFLVDIYINFFFQIQKAILTQVFQNNSFIYKKIYNLLSKNKNSILEYIYKEYKYIIREIKALQLVVKKLKKATFTKSTNSKYLDIFFFTNKSIPSSYKRQQYIQNYNYSIKDTIRRLINKINIELDIYYYFYNATNLNTISTLSSLFKTSQAYTSSLASSLLLLSSFLRSLIILLLLVLLLSSQFKILTLALLASSTSLSKLRYSR